MNTTIIKSGVKTTSKIGLNDCPVKSGDFSNIATALQANGFRGSRKFLVAGEGVKAFCADTKRGDDVDVEITDNLIYDKRGKYGYSENGVSVPFKDSEGNYDYTKIPLSATDFNDNIEGYETTTGKKIRVSDYTIKSALDGFQTKNLAYGGYYRGEISGVSITYNNGSFTVKGTTNGCIYSYNELFRKPINLKKGNYFFKSNKNFEGTIIINNYNTNTKIAESYSRKFFSLFEDTTVYVGIYSSPNNTIDSTIEFQIGEGADYTPFVPPLAKLDYLVEQANAKGYKLVREAWRNTEGNTFEAEITPSLYFNRNVCVDSKIILDNTPLKDIIFSVDALSLNPSDTPNYYLISRLYDDKIGVGLYCQSREYCIFNLTGLSYHFSPSTQSYVFNNFRIKYEFKDLYLYYNDIKSTTIALNTSVKVTEPLYIGVRCPSNNNTGYNFIGYIYSTIINDNYFIPSTNGMINITTNEFLHLLDLNGYPV